MSGRGQQFQAFEVQLGKSTDYWKCFGFRRFEVYPSLGENRETLRLETRRDGSFRSSQFIGSGWKADYHLAVSSPASFRQAGFVSKILSEAGSWLYESRILRLQSPFEAFADTYWM